MSALSAGIHNRRQCLVTFLSETEQLDLFRQLLEYLKSKPDPDSRVLGSRIGREGIAATAMTLRWGSYLAVLLDREKSVWAEVKSTGISRISDGEMARINIEASA